ncbi:hypothetical protein KUV50_13165 [Membranicola marinus]|uniref:DNA topoisomerase n=1 Tax=Membranihabitans marinus TaxID=1227546 RepID=A0A953HVN9_9BACT|nr:hypothetical protein [Membranihabitans marinus]MBY5959095.1 hypothetical protein [Membranihabitans marinus]
MYHRKKHGRGFRYVDENGKTIRDDNLKEWFKSLVIPPAWTEVEISEKKSADLLVTGRDGDGRKQYIYHPDYVEKQNQKKFDRITEFGERLETMRRVTGQHLRKRKMTREKVLAAMVRLMDEAYFRPGNPRYTEENESYGLTTLRSKHLEIDKNEIIFSYKGKSGKDQEHRIRDRKLVRIVQELDEIPGYRIFKYLDENGDKHEVDSDDLNNYIHEIMGEEFSAKDFRTWAGTLIAAMALDELGVEDKEDQKALDKKVREAVVKVSERLGNTPAVARSAYIDPRIVDHYMDGKTIGYFSTQIEQILDSPEHLSREERCVLHMLKSELN